MARRRRLSEATLREDAKIAAAGNVIAAQLAARYPSIAGLVIAARLLYEAHADLDGQADALGKAPEEPAE